MVPATDRMDVAEAVTDPQRGFIFLSYCGSLIRAV